MDNKFTEQLSAYVNKEPHSEKEIQDAAMLLRQIAPRNMLYIRYYQLACMKPRYIEAHIIAECRKHLKYRLDNLTREEVKVLDTTVHKEAHNILTEGEPSDGEDGADDGDGSAPKKLGRREDHDSLPDDIKGLWTRNGELYKKIKDEFEVLKSMADAQACDRYEHLKVLDELDKEYLGNMQKYDNYVADGTPAADGAPAAEDETPKPEEKKLLTEEEIAKAVAAARSYISKNLGKFEAMLKAFSLDPTTDTEKKIDELRAKLTDKVSVLVDNKAVIKDDLKQKLITVGLLKDEEV